MDLYAENILDHYRHPRLKEPLVASTISHEETNVSCGDTLTLSLTLKGDRVVGVGWDGSGCAISQAGMSMLAEELAGKSLSDLDAMNAKHILDLLGVPIGPRRTKCAFLCLHALKNALHLHREEAVQGWRETMEEMDKMAE